MTEGGVGRVHFKFMLMQVKIIMELMELTLNALLSAFMHLS